MADPRRDDLTDRLDELEETLSTLRDELESPRGRRLPRRPPSPRELLRFTDEYAIPTAIAMLEANVRALELLQASIRATDPDHAADAATTAVRDGMSGVSGATLDRLDRALAEIESSLAGGGTPRNPEARELVAEARRLNDEIADRLTATGTADREEAVRIDVESELDSIREEVSEGGAEEGSTDEA